MTLIQERDIKKEIETFDSWGMIQDQWFANNDSWLRDIAWINIHDADNKERFMYQVVIITGWKCKYFTLKLCRWPLGVRQIYT